MKKHFFIFVLFFGFLAAPAHAVLGRHNGQISLGAAGLLKDGELLGYAMNIELGYLLHSVRASKTIHGMDLRLGFELSYPRYSISGIGIKLSTSIQNLMGTLGIAYAAGREIKGHRLMFDVIGYGVSFGSARPVVSVNLLGIRASAKGDAFFGLRMDFILPLGINFIASNGVSAGFRHKISFPLGSIRNNFVTYSMIFHIGYAFGEK